jgi:hypothetical protein
MVCPRIKQQMKECRVKGFEDFTGGDMRDPAEFLAYLFHVFEVEGAVTYTRQTGMYRLLLRIVNHFS